MKPKHAKAASTLASVWLDEGRHAEVVALLTPFSEAKKPKLSVLLKLARAQDRGGDLAAAAGTLDRALEASPKSPGALRRAADVAMRRGDLQAARAFVARGLAEKPNHDQLRALDVRLKARE